MKKAISLILALVLCLSLCACGGGTENTASNTTESTSDTTVPAETKLSKDEMLAIAEEVSIADISNTSFENLAKAKELYCNKVMILTGQIDTISEDHIQIGNTDYLVDVYLPSEELVRLEKYQVVTVVGRTTDTIEKVTTSTPGMSFDSNHYQMPDAYFVNDHYEIKGVIQTAGILIYGKDGTLLDGIRTLKWAENVTEKPAFGDEVTISARFVFNKLTNKTEYHDATIVK